MILVLLPGNEVWGIAGENRLQCACVFLPCFFFCFSALEMLCFDNCWVPRSPSLSFDSFPPSSKLKKPWLVAIFSPGIELPRAKQHGRMQWAHIQDRFSLSCSCLRVCGLSHHRFFFFFFFFLKPREANHFPEAGAIPSVFSLRLHVSIRPSETLRAKMRVQSK